MENVGTDATVSAKKGSYPSRQRRFGPAPLASFEDLPSDDQKSPDFDSSGGISGLRDSDVSYMSPDQNAIEKALELDSSSLLRQNTDTSPTQTITPICMSPPIFPSAKRGSDTASQNTITSDGRFGSSPVIEKSGSFSSLRPGNRSDAGSISSEQKGSYNSLLAVPDANNEKGSSDDSKRKGSWTDIFFPGRLRSKSTSSSPRKSPTGERKKSAIFKILSFGRKSPAKELSSPSDQSQAIQSVGTVETPRVSVTDTSENEPNEELIIHSPTNEPKASEQDILGIIEAANSQMVATPIDDISNVTTIMPPLNLRKTLKRRESTIDDEVRSLPEILPSSRSKDRDLMTNSNNMETVVVQIETCSTRDDRDSSESEIGFNENSLKIKKNVQNKSESEDDFEAENLLTQESIDYDDTSLSENIGEALRVERESVKSPTRRERLDVTTIPIERPRSTTPINIVPLEAYIRSSSISPDPNLEKIKLSLPGEQFTATARAKSPRKSNPSIWFDFCEKGLQSPRSRRKQRANSCLPTDSSDSENFYSNMDAFCASSQSVTVSTGVTPDTPQNTDDFNNESKWPGFGDNFVNFDSIMSSTNGLTNESEIHFSCRCDCNISAITSTVTNGNTLSQTSDSTAADDNSNNKNSSSLSTADHEYMEDQPLVSPCHCVCHRRADFALSLWKSSSLNKQESVSSDISSASSRLIGSSSSASKCSPTDESAIELNS